MLVRSKWKGGKDDGVRWGINLGSGERKFNIEIFFFK